MPKRTERHSTYVPAGWHCVLDRNWRQVYLGTDEVAARSAMQEGCVMASRPTMGEAVKAAAMKVGEASKNRAGSGGRD